jgi:tetratricopeptide (TPR) repeat protein
MRSLALALLLPAVPAAPAEPERAPTAAVDPPATAVASPPPATPAPTGALLEKLGAGDRAFLAGDYRPALFAYQDAVYMEPTSAVARIRLARAYVALGHPEQAGLQLKVALELDPGNAEARRMAEEMANPAPAAPRREASIVSVANPAQATAPAPKLYRLTDEAGGPAPPIAAAAAPTSPEIQAAASRHYRNALAMIRDRDFAGAIAELDQALRLNPRLGVAHAARASALHGLGRFQEAVGDYEAALKLSPELATPLYGLAETYRQLQDPRAGDYFARYAGSTAGDVQPELRETARQRAIQLGH